MNISLGRARASHRASSMKWDNNAIVIRTDLLNELLGITDKLEFLRGNVLLEILSYPLVRRLQKQMLNIVADGDVLWMIERREVERGYWRRYYRGLEFHLNYCEYYSEEGDGDNTWFPDLDEEFKTHLLKPVKEDVLKILKKHDPFPRLNYKFLLLLLGIYVDAFFVIFALIVIIGRFI